MSQVPPNYERSYSFTDFSINTPNLQQPGNKIDQELNNVRTSLNATIARLSEIQYDDGHIKISQVNINAIAAAAAVPAQAAAAAAEVSRLQAQAARNDTYASAAEIDATKTYVTNIANGMSANNAAALASIASSVSTVNGYIQVVSDYASAAQTSATSANESSVYAEQYANNASDFATQADLSAQAAAASAASAPAVPTGGSAGQVLAKIDSTDYHTEWVNQSGGTANALPLAGGTMDAGALQIFPATNGKDSEIGAWGFGVEQTDGSYSTVEPTVFTSRLTSTYNYSDPSNPINPPYQKNATFSANGIYGSWSAENDYYFLLNPEGVNGGWENGNKWGITNGGVDGASSDTPWSIGIGGVGFPDGTVQTSAAGTTGIPDGVNLNQQGISGNWSNESTNDSSWSLTSNSVSGVDIEGSWSFGTTGIHFADGSVQTTSADPLAYLQGQSNPDYTSVLNPNSGTFGTNAYFTSLEVSTLVFGLPRGISADSSGLKILPSSTLGFMSSFDPADITYQTTAFTGWNNVTLTGDPKAPTPATSDNDTSIATTAFVKAQQYITTSSAASTYLSQSSAASTYFAKPTGTTSQYIDGTGGLQTFPTVGTAGKMVMTAYNGTGASIPMGSVVYISGSHGNDPQVSLARADAEATSAFTIAVAQAAVANGSNGTFITSGLLEGFATNGYGADGTLLYLSSTVAGGLTATKQFSPNHYVKIGTIVRSHPTAGTIFIKVENGYQLDELSDCYVTAPTNNNVLTFESSTGLWKDKSVTTALGYTPANDTLGNLSSASTARTNLGVAYATDAQVIAGTSASTVLTPAQSQFGMQNWVVPTTLTTSVATGTVTSTGFGSRCQLTATASGQYAIVYPSNSSIATFTNSGANYTDSNFSKRIKICGRIYCSMTAGLNAYYAWGRSNNTPSTIGSPVVKGFGIRIQGTGAVELQVHNGTTLTNVTSSFTPTTNQVFDCLIDSIGDGNVNLYINGALVATSSAGATGTQAGFPLLIQELSSTASSTVGNFYVTGKTLYFA